MIKDFINRPPPLISSIYTIIYKEAVNRKQTLINNVFQNM